MDANADRNDRQMLLTDEDIQGLRTDSKFQRFLETLHGMIDGCRKEVDRIPEDLVKELQGRIRAYKKVISIFDEENL